MIQEVSAIQAQNLAELLNLLQQVAGPYLDARVREGEIKADVAKEALGKVDARITAEQFNAFLERWAAGQR